MNNYESVYLSTIAKKAISLLATISVSTVLLAEFMADTAYAGRTNQTTTLTRNFSGVRSCSRSSRQNDEARIAINSFLNRQSRPAYERSWSFTERNYNNRTSSTGKRSCTGRIRIRLNYYTVAKDFTICNRTNANLKFSFKWSGQSSSKSISANDCLRYTNWHPDTYIDFDGSFRDGYQRVTYTLRDGWRYNFRRDGSRGIELYHEN